MSAISTTCPACQTRLQVSTQHAGQTLPCPKCGAGVIATVPPPVAPRKSCPLKARLPGIALALYSTAFLSYGLYGVIASLPQAGELMRLDFDSERGETAKAILWLVVAAYVLQFLLTGFMLVGGLLLALGKSWRFGVAAAIVAMLPCSLFVVFSLPLGIWTLVALSDRLVREAIDGYGNSN